MTWESTKEFNPECPVCAEATLRRPPELPGAHRHVVSCKPETPQFGCGAFLSPENEQEMRDALEHWHYHTRGPVLGRGYQASPEMVEVRGSDWLLLQQLYTQCRRLAQTVHGSAPFYVVAVGQKWKDAEGIIRNITKLVGIPWEEPK